MTNDAKNSKINFSLRMNTELSDQIEKEAAKIGLTKNAYITMVLHLALAKKDS